MLIPLPEIVSKYNLNIKGVIEVGAHYAEEHEVFVQLGIKNIAYIEPCKNSYRIMVDKIVVKKESGSITSSMDGLYYGYIGDDSEIYKFFNLACGEEEGEFDMFVSTDNQGQSNSLLEPKLHLQQHPEVRFNEYERVKVMPLDKLAFQKENYNLLMMDVQGAEGLVLKGATETLKHIDIIYTECNRGQTYAGNMEIEEMDEFLKPFGFERVETYWPSPNLSWGDSVFLRASLLNK